MFWTLSIQNNSIGSVPIRSPNTIPFSGHRCRRLSPLVHEHLDCCAEPDTAKTSPSTLKKRSQKAVILSTGARINYCFMSDALKEVEGFNWIRKGEGLSRDTATFAFNQNPVNIRRAERDEDTSDLQDWFGSYRSLSATEQVIGLSNYGKTLTVLTALDIEDQIEEIKEEEELVESWTPRFRR